MEQNTLSINHIVNEKIDECESSVDAIEQDSLESNKESKAASGYSSPILPIIAQLEEKLTNYNECAKSAQNSSIIEPSNSINNTNQCNVGIDTNAATNAPIESNNHQSNNSNKTNKSSYSNKHASDVFEYDFQDLPGLC